MDEYSGTVVTMDGESWDAAVGDELIPHCSVQSKLGGGFAYEAYACFDEQLLASVVIKILRPHLVHNVVALRTLVRETSILGRLNHPVIVRGLHAEVGGDRPYLALERLTGPRLSTLVRKYGPLSIEQILPLGMQLASALHYLHGCGIVHLDIKPSNIIMEATPRLIDFSIARTVEEAATLDHVVGTNQYLSPEQADPLGENFVGPGSDVWALGFTLAEAISGVRPELGEPAALPGLPTHVAALIRDCLDPIPEARPTPAELFNACDQWAARLPRPRVTAAR